MSQIASQIGSAISQTTGQLGQTITYVPLCGLAKLFLAVIEEVDAVLAQLHAPAAISIERRNFLIQIADYAADPVRGDSIQYAGDTYIVMVPSDRQAAWEWSDKFNFRRRVFTKRTA